MANSRRGWSRASALPRRRAAGLKACSTCSTRLGSGLTLAGLVVATLALAQPAATVRGIVFHDRNGNGVHDAGEPGLAGVAVSNQADVVSTDAEGRYTLDAARGYGLVSVSLPSGWRTVSAPWRAIDARAGSVEDFALAEWPLGADFSFLHVTDPHTAPDSVARLALARRVVEERWPAFVLLTGDLVTDALGAGEAEARGYFELYRKTVGDFPVPVWSVLGNHDVFGIERDKSGASTSNPLYGKAMFRHYLGPDHYSFNAGRIHFVALDTVGIAGTQYYGYVDDAQLEWLERDLAAMPHGAVVVTFGHIPLLTGALSAWGYRDWDNAGATAIDVGGRRLFRHVVNNTPDVMARLARVRWPLALGGHTHGRESLVFETTGQRTRFEQGASVVVPWETDPIPMAAGVTLYRVRGTEIDAGEFIRLGGGQSR